MNRGAESSGPYFRQFLSVLLVLLSGTATLFGQAGTSVGPLAEPAPVGAETSQVTLEKSVVMIRAVQQDFDYATPWKQMPMAQGTGSGFIIAGNRILTNAHNISNNKYVEIKKQNLPTRYPAIIAYVGHDCDLAILTVLDKAFFDDMVPLELGPIPTVNSTVQTYGFPVGGNQVSVTEGVVSRVQMGSYTHTQADSHLVVQTDAAINPGNSGGPVMQDGKVVGVAFQGLREADNIGYMIPTPVIRHFLEDIEDRKYDGFGSLGFTFFAGLHNKAYAEYLKVPPGEQGVVVLETLMHSSVENILKPGDVVTAIDEFAIDNDAMTTIYGRTLHFSEAVERKQMGQTVHITFFRKGEKLTADAVVALNRPVLEYARQYDLTPRYFVYAGLIFVPVNRNYLEMWGRNWITEIPHYLRYLFADATFLNTDRERVEYVVLSSILPDEVNAYSSPFEDKVVDSVNGVKIWKLSDLAEAFGKDVGGSCVITFLGDTTPLVLDRKAAEERHKPILERYEVPAPFHLENSQ